METTAPKSRERLQLGSGFARTYTISLFVGGIGLVLAILVGYFMDPSLRRFYFSYLVSFAFFLSVSLGALFFVILQHLTRAGWSVGMRRIAETLACMFPILAALSAPIVVSVITQKGDLYRWAQPISRVESKEASSTEADKPVNDLREAMEVKRAWLNPTRFLACAAVYFGVWTLMGGWFWKQSVTQDKTRDDSITLKMQQRAAPAALALGITLTYAAFDFLMSLDPTWYSTMFGIYYFAGCAVAIFATLILAVFLLQANGYLEHTVTLEHYHDLGKFLFAFTFFWGYIAFSQYMLLWYANIPSTAEWFARRGATTAAGQANGWSVIGIMLIFGHLFIPFAGLMSRHIKRKKKILLFWAIWMLVFHWFDLLWIVMPELDGKFHLGILDFLCFAGVGGIYLAALLRIALKYPLRPVADPRLPESLVFENV